MPKIPFFHQLISTGFGSGYCPAGPGTAGAALALLLWWSYAAFLSSSSTFLLTVVLIAVFTVLGVWSSTVAEHYWGSDPKRVVVDEMVGTWVALLAVPSDSHWGYSFAAFALFRFFDIAKPLGVRQMERLKGGYGIMADDLLAGFYSCLILLFIIQCCA